MSKNLRDKVLEAGIVPENAVSQMEQWQAVPQGSAAKVGEFDQKKVDALKEDLELKALPVLHESVLDIKKIMEKAKSVMLIHKPLALQAEAGRDRLGRYIFAIPDNETDYNALSAMMRPLTHLTDNELTSPRNNRIITAVSVLYATIEEGQESVPTHWFCETEAKGEETIVRGGRRA